MHRLVAGLGVVLVLTTGCARSRLSLMAESVQIPVSLSESFFDGDVLTLRERYEVVHHFRFEEDRVTLNGLVPARKVDMSERLQRIATEHSGDAIVNLRISGRDRAGWSLLTFLTTICTAGLLAPSYVGVTIEGDVARMLPPAPAAAPAVDPPGAAPAGPS